MIRAVCDGDTVNTRRVRDHAELSARVGVQYFDLRAVRDLQPPRAAVESDVIPAFRAFDRVAGLHAILAEPQSAHHEMKNIRVGNETVDRFRTGPRRHHRNLFGGVLILQELIYRSNATLV